MFTTVAKLVGRGILIAGFFVLVVTALYARDNTLGITFATGNGLDLRIDSEATYNGVFVPSGTWELKNLVPGVDKFWNFNDIKPGDQGENTISLHPKNKDAWMCLDIKNLKSFENGVNEPESHADNTSGSNDGELTKVMKFFAWYDDGDNKFEKGEKYLFSANAEPAWQVLNNKTYTLGDYSNGKVYKDNKTAYVAIYWCAGNLTVNLNDATLVCDGSTTGNESQTDSMTVDVSIRAVPVSENPKFLCKGDLKKDEGCSPGYWKQEQHFGSWKAPYTPNKLFSSVFENAFPGKTLLQVLGLGGGGLNALGRQTVAALLNAANPNVNYPYSTSQVISMFNNVYPGGNYEELKNKLEKLNTIYCPLSNDKIDEHPWVPPTPPPPPPVDINPWVPPTTYN